MSRALQDQVIDDDENDTCPLCIEEFDLSDRNFRPCPCGYQICQFCYNNIRTSMNGLCPACRRVYDDKNIQWKSISPEELASYRENAQQAAKKKQAAKQKEAAKREADSLSRKHLAGIRVRQKNLVYITGMRPSQGAENLSETLRRDEYFGQYGKIIKVVVSKAKDTSNPNAPVGVYVTFANKEDAARCIQVVDGSPNYDSRLRAQYGTTKYCSAYLRGENCSKSGCMFLHEPGDENESFSRQDLSSMNVISTQSPSQANMLSSSHLPQPQPPPQQAPQSTAAAAPPNDPPGDKGDAQSPAENINGPALPHTASWASKPTSGRSAVSVLPSPQAPISDPVYQETTSAFDTSTQPEDRRPELGANERSKADGYSKKARAKRATSPLSTIRKLLSSGNVGFVFDEDAVGHQDRTLMHLFPPLFDPYGAARRKIISKRETERTIRETDNQVATQALSAMDLEETAEGGSLQLGGEPEERHDLALDGRGRQTAIQPPAVDNTSSSLLFGVENSLSPPAVSNPTMNGRGMTPQQQQLLLQHFKSASPSPFNSNQSTQSQTNHSSSAGPSHTRQGSRYSFANDSTASASVKPVANPKLMSQQNSMMPPSHSNQYNSLSQYQSSNQFFSSGVQGPPPGLKATGTPPVSGGGMFGQGHGFATAGLGYGVNTTNRNANDEMMRELLRNRGGSAGSGQASDTGRREYMFPSIHQHNSQSSSPTLNPGLSSFPYGPQPGTIQDHGPQKQKKKGKKHRHANTSSSGGGVVDLADPSILQAQSRMHQPGGLYNAQNQGQGGFNSMMLGNNGFGFSILRKHSKELLANSPFQSGLESSRPSSPTLFGSQRSTPALPPGLGLLSLGKQQRTLKDDFNEYATLMPELGRIPVAPVEQQSSANIGQFGPKPLSYTCERIGSTSTEPRAQIGYKQTDATKTVPETSSEVSFPALPKSVSAKTEAPRPKRVESASFKGKVTQKTEAFERMPKAVGKAKQEQPLQPIAAKPVQRQPLEKLDISAARQSDFGAKHIQDVAEVSSKLDTAFKPVREQPATPSENLRPETPGVASEATTTRPTHPRTIRVLPTMKADGQNLPTQSMTSINTSKQNVKSPKQPSRQPSVVSLSTAPETPASEKVPDSASVATEPPSRADTPDSSSKGGASVKPSAVSKTQKRKERERQWREKKLAEEHHTADKDSPPAADAVIHEPIIGRKKKTKKRAASPNVGASLPSELARPTSSTREAKQNEMVGERFEKAASSLQRPTTFTPEASAATADINSNGSVEQSPSLLENLLCTLKQDGELRGSALHFFKQPYLTSSSYDLGFADVLNPLLYGPLTDQELQILESGKPVRRHGNQALDQTHIGKDKDNKASDTTSRLLITPYTRVCICGLSFDLENRIIELETRIHKSKPPLKYSHRKAPSGRPTAEDMLNDVANAMIARTSQSTPTAEKLGNKSNNRAPQSTLPSKQPAYADDALAYLDQFILPVPSPRRVSASAIGVVDETVNNQAFSAQGHASPSIGSERFDAYSIATAIPRTYTTGDPTFSVCGVHLPASAQNEPSGSTYRSALDLAADNDLATPLHPATSATPVNSATTRAPPFIPNLNFLANHEAVTEALVASFRGISENLQRPSSAKAANGSVNSVNLTSLKLSAANENGGGGGFRGGTKESLTGAEVNSSVLAAAAAAAATNSDDPSELVKSVGAETVRQALAASGIGNAQEVARKVAGIVSSVVGPSAAQVGRGGGGFRDLSRKGSGESDKGDDALLAQLEQELATAKREYEGLEKKIGALVKRNRKTTGLAP